MSVVDLNLLATQLAALARDLSDEISVLGGAEEAAVDAEAEYRYRAEEYDDAWSRAYLDADGSVEARKCVARLQVIQERLLMQEAQHRMNKMKSQVKTQQASLNALHKRIDVGRSLLSREKALISLSGVGEA